MFGIDDMAVAAIGSSIIGGVMQNDAISSANAANIQASRETNQATMDFQREMSNTAWQRGVNDMEKAGLNPMLAYGMGPASVPGGSSQVPTIQPASALGKSVSSAAGLLTSLENTRADTEVKKATVGATDAAADKARTEASLNQALTDKAKQDTAVSTVTASNLSIQSDVLRNTAAKVAAETSNIQSDSKRLDAITQKVLEETKNVPLERAQIAATIQSIYMATKQRGQEMTIRGPEETAAQGGTPTGWAKWLPDVGKLTHSAGQAMQELHDRSKFMQWMDKP